MKGFVRKNQLLSLCGLNCGLCTMRIGDYCGGCRNGNQSCAIARCSLAHDGVEYCFECREFPCEKYRDAGQYDSFITHRRQMDDLALAARDGIEAYNAVQREKVEILHRLLSEYNDGRKKTLFSLAVNLMKLPDLQRVMALIDTQDNAGTMPQKDRAKLAADILQQIADERKLVLKLNRKK